MSESKNTQYIIYSKQNCTYCVQAKTLLTMKGLEFEERKIDENPELLEELKKLVPNVKTVPQIFSNKKLTDATSEWKHIGGFSELAARLATDTN
jgi:glutaredoxin 3